MFSVRVCFPIESKCFGNSLTVILFIFVTPFVEIRSVLMCSSSLRRVNALFTDAILTLVPLDMNVADMGLDLLPYASV